MIIYMMSNKLDSITNRDWEEYRCTLEKSPTLTQFCTYINNKADLLETIEEKANKQTNNNHKSYILTKQSSSQQNQQYRETNKILQCPMCSKPHLLYSCETFRGLPVATRIAKVKIFGVCMNCLRPGHTANRCKLSHCKYCKIKHNTMLHVEPLKNIQDPMPSVALPVGITDDISTSKLASENVTLSSNIYQRNAASSHILLSTALVKAVNDKGKRFEARLLLDNGSTANFVSHALCDKMGLSRFNTSSTVTGINNQTSISTQSCRLTIESNTSSFKADINCFILPEVTKNLPTSTIDVSKIPIPSNLQLADPFFYLPSEIDILVGADIFWNVLGNCSISLGKNNPKLCDTKLGWLVSGPVIVSRASSQSHNCNFTLNELDSKLAKFWEIDSILPKYTFSQEERACEESFLQNTFRDESGQFVVTMPLKSDPSVLGNSYNIAKNRFLSLERRFQRDLNFKNRYVEFMHEYENLGHMSENARSSKPHAGNVPEYFLPHHGVIKETRTTTKFRTVFDGSMSTSTGKSLNDLQMVGPTLQNDLTSILLRFRQHKYVISSDVEKMYRAVKLNPSQRQLQQIIFREDPSLPLKIFYLNTVTYGQSCAAYLATKCLVTLADTASDERVKKSIQNDFYVDDYLSGGDSIPEVVELANKVSSILSSAKFFLRKWKSNSNQVLAQIPDALDQSNTLNFAEGQDISTKTLGLQWICQPDTLGFTIDIDCNKKVTKRHILSVISQIFDPLGLIGPCLVESRVIMQKLWIANCDWDTEIPQQLHEAWLLFARSLPCLNNLKIPRRIFLDSAVHELHVFTDASERAYGAAIYARSTENNGAVKVQLIASKSRLAPIKHTTIPRLELAGALLGTRLFTKVLESLTLPIERCRFWSDSTIVLCWLRTKPNLLKPFVRNRVSEIQETTAGHSWGYTDTKQNPGDIISRGLKADLIHDCSLWWFGPEFLSKDESCWPNIPNNNEQQDLSEVVSSHVNDLQFLANQSFHQSQVDTESLISKLIHKHSDINRLQRTLAYIQRFIYNCKNNATKRQGLLSPSELANSSNLIIKNAQLEMFKTEHDLLQSRKPLPRKNRLISLSPFVDNDKIIRVGGRLDHSPYDYNVKHPILICSKHHYSKCLFQKEHVRLLHAGPQLLLANIRQNYWPLGGKNLSKCTVKRCVKCFRQRCQTIQPIMGQLPNTRTELEYPFLNCSVDYFGPVLISDRKGRGCKLIKSYVCIILCQAVKAAHIELVTELTKEAYMAALNRFVSRRGKPRSILSDNATNFVGTCNELQVFLQESDIAYDIAQQGIEFLFVPPYTPHFNGLAEAAVRSAKHHLKRLLQLTHFTFEEMATCLTQIEAVLNSRPLTPISSDPLDFTALTPAHFLIGRSLMSVPHPQVDDIDITRLKRYQRIEHIKQHFWNRFQIEYVSLLQSKTKWTHPTEQQLSLGALVLVKEKGQPPLLWPLGRVTKLMPGDDSCTRVAELKTSRGTLLRAFNNICPLPIS